MLNEKCTYFNSHIEASLKKILGHLYKIMGKKYSVYFKYIVYFNFSLKRVPAERLHIINILILNIGTGIF